MWSYKNSVLLNHTKRCYKLRWRIPEQRSVSVLKAGVFFHINEYPQSLSLSKASGKHLKSCRTILDYIIILVCFHSVFPGMALWLPIFTTSIQDLFLMGQLENLTFIIHPCSEGSKVHTNISPDLLIDYQPAKTVKHTTQTSLFPS